MTNILLWLIVVHLEVIMWTLIIINTYGVGRLHPHHRTPHREAVDYSATLQVRHAERPTALVRAFCMPRRAE